MSYIARHYRFTGSDSRWYLKGNYGEFRFLLQRDSDRDWVASIVDGARGIRPQPMKGYWPTRDKAAQALLHWEREQYTNPIASPEQQIAEWARDPKLRTAMLREIANAIDPAPAGSLTELGKAMS